MIYAVFFTATGINLFLLNTITGKLIKVKRRGAMSLLGTVFGATIAVTCAWRLLKVWLVDEQVGGVNQSSFGSIFCLTGTMFVAAAVCVLFLKERPDIRNETGRSAIELFKAFFATLRDDKNFRTVAIIAAMFGMYLSDFVSALPTFGPRPIVAELDGADPLGVGAEHRSGGVQYSLGLDRRPVWESFSAADFNALSLPSTSDGGRDRTD